MKHLIELKDYSYTCWDWCCSNYWTNVFVDGKQWKYNNDDVETILEQVLDMLWIEYEIKRTYNWE